MKVCKCSASERWSPPQGFIYCGRWSDRFGVSALRNPIRRGSKCGVCGEIHETGGSTLPCFRKHLWEMLTIQDDGVLAALRAIQADSVLGCWCLDSDNPLDVVEVCHTQVIWKAWHWMKTQEAT